ncbi:hypothetical protein BHE74_00014945 [Ensete ventricosum]|uniref:Uncharacterized protein n=1 Tax=Ensete ventricosum TaxID=4639 RepID=A0A444F5R8_ENSVE|nr:hypothetical protein GW17_00018076 [Ensete ventricosum]RWW76925.1 hypothetical protein BHE74_00014945 [Ensete ventricosum]RZR71056.1 hypothetical protein BHM03_00003062 [Ensete ventricosum]
MATTSLASAASSFVLTSNLSTATATTNRSSRFSFFTFIKSDRKLVVRVEEASMSPPALTTKGGSMKLPRSHLHRHRSTRREVPR